MKKFVVPFAAGIVAALILILVMFSSLFSDLVYTRQEVSSTEAVLKAFKKQGKLQVIKMYLEQVHKEEVVRDLFGIDFLAPDSKTLVSFTSVATACVDLTKVEAGDVMVENGRIVIDLPEPNLCDDPYIVSDSFKVYDQNLVAKFLDPQQEITAQQKAIQLAVEKALDNEILVLARDQAESVVEKFLGVVTDMSVEVRFEQ